LKRRTATLCVLVVGLAGVSLGCLSQKGGTTPSTKQMNIYIAAKKPQTYGSTDVRVTISCYVINHGDPGYVTVCGHVKSWPRTGKAPTFDDDGEKRIHLNRDEQTTVTFDLDISAGTLPDSEAEWEYMFDYHSEQPD